MNARGRLLIVDDKDNMRALLRDILADQHDVTLAGDGAVARDLLDHTEFDVVLTDVRMPGLDGLALVQHVKRQWPSTEVVMITAHASIADAVEAMRRGAYDYIRKPFDPDDVTLVVARALERRNEQVAATQVAEARPQTMPPSSHLSPEELATLSYRQALASARDRGSREYLTALLKAFGGNVSRAAERAGLERESLHRLLRTHGIRAENYRSPGSTGEAS
jgi:DNA-binding NtrC family response regulator